MSVTDSADAVPAGDRPSPRGRLAFWGDAAVGAAFEARAATADVIAALRRIAMPGPRVAGWADRGAAERAHGRQRASTAVESAVLAVASSPVVDRVVDRQVERILRPVVRAVLDDVLRLLEEDPERIQALIRGQRDSMVDELVGRLRAGAAAGDTAVDRLALRVFHRNARPAPTPPAP